MELANTFRVAASIDSAWSVLTDVPRVAACLPGAQLLESTDDEYRGLLKVKVGPIKMQYQGTMKFLEVDESYRKLILKGEGRDARGQGGASALITAQLVEEEEFTRVTVMTDLQVTGKVAQFGRNVMADVSEKMVSQFAQNLEAEVSGKRSSVTQSDPNLSGIQSGTPPDRDEDSRSAESLRSTERATDDYVDLTSALQHSLAQRTRPLVVAGLVVVVLVWIGSRRR
ncbi:SRPBCC family protein [Nocardioides hungaricus]